MNNKIGNGSHKKQDFVNHAKIIIDKKNSTLK